MKKKLYTVLAVLLLGGIIFTVTQSTWLKGAFTSNPALTNPTIPIITYQAVASAEEAKDLALESRNNAEEYATSAETNATEATNAYTNNDAETLSTAQSEASSNANLAETQYNRAQHYADEAYSYYEDAQTEFEEAQVEEEALAQTVIDYNESNLDAQEQLEEAQANYDEELRQFNWCTSDSNCSEIALSTYESELQEAEDTLDMATAYADDWQVAWENAVDEYTAYYAGTYSDAKDARDEAKDFYEEAQAYADEAFAFATNAAQAEEVASSYSFLSCSSLAISPSSYEMDPEDSSASFDITATVSANSGSSASLWNPQWGQAFTLVEIQQNVNITGIIKAIPVTPVSDTSKWVGTLVFEANGYGEFTQDSSSDNPLEIQMSSAGTETVSFSGGSAGDAVTVSVKDEETLCSQSFTITQEDTASVVLTESSGSTALTEDGSTDTYTVELNSQPTADVNIAITPDSQATVSSSTLTFNTSNWSTAQTITVTAVDDSTVEGTHSAVITHTSSSSDADYNGITVNSITASVTDNETTSSTDTDDDGDGISDDDEVYIYGTDPLLTDTDGDGLSDYEEVFVYDTDPLDKTSASTGTCNALTLSPSTVELDEDESSTIAVEVDIDGTWDGGVYVVWSDNDGFVTTTDGEVFESEFEGEGPLTTGTYYLLYTSGGNSGTEDETETLSISLEGSSCTDTIEITIPATNALTSTEDCEEDYQDVEDDDWYAETVCRLTDAGFVEGRVQYSSYSLFYPGDEITKAEVLKLISLILLDLDEDDAEGGSSDFVDLATTDWYWPWVINTEDEDVLRTRDAGTTGNFNSNITRGELAVYIARALGLTSYSFDLEYTDVDEDDWFAYAVALLSRTDEEFIKDMLYDGTDEKLPVITGYEGTDGEVTFEPYNDINRAEALTMIYRAYQIYIAE